jgi:O-antigen ligase
VAPVVPARSFELTSPVIAAASPFNVVLLVTSLLIINHIARPFEKVLVGLHLPVVLCSLGVLVLIVCGGLKRITSSTGIALSVFVFWLMMTVPQSMWRRGSLNYVLSYLFFFFVVMLMVAQAPRSVKDLIRLSWVIGSSCLFAIVTGGDVAGDRFASTGTYGNADDVALMAGFGIPFMILIAAQFKTAIPRYALMALGGGYLLFAAARTATRAAIPALVLMVGVYFFRSRAFQKIWIVVISVVMVLAMLVVLPHSTLKRLATILDSFDEQSIQQQMSEDEAMASTAARRDLLFDAVKTTLDHPFFGVGPGEFQDYRFNVLKRIYFPSHNTYAQIGAETGIPGVLSYLIFLGTIFWTVRRVRKLTLISNHPDSEVFNQVSTCVEAALVYFAACAFFMTCDRHPHQFLLAGMAIAMERLLQHWTSQKQGVASISKGPGRPAPMGRASQIPKYPASPLPAKLNR